jgi:hypothetical protein
MSAPPVMVAVALAVSVLFFLVNYVAFTWGHRLDRDRDRRDRFTLEELSAPPKGSRSGE